MYFKRFKLSSFLILMFLGLAITACENNKKNIKQTEVSFKKEGELTIFKKTSDSTNISLDIEIADTDYDRQTGLMYRNALEENQGMLFIFDDTRPRTFYMKNTRIPLDIIYINDVKTMVSFQKNAKPFDEISLPSNTPAKYVLEINAGLVDKWSLVVGDSISYKE